jgi:hypothetical protein
MNSRRIDHHRCEKASLGRLDTENLPFFL